MIFCRAGGAADETAALVVSKEQLLGPWKRSLTNQDTNSVNSDQVTFNTDGTYMELQDEYDGNSQAHTYSVYQGTYAFDTAGKVTMTTTEKAQNLAAFSTEDAAGTTIDKPIIGNETSASEYAYIRQ